MAILNGSWIYQELVEGLSSAKQVRKWSNTGFTLDLTLLTNPIIGENERRNVSRNSSIGCRAISLRKYIILDRTEFLSTHDVLLTRWEKKSGMA
jgi:hypothetical protein